MKYIETNITFNGKKLYEKIDEVKPVTEDYIQDEKIKPLEIGDYGCTDVGSDYNNADIIFHITKAEHKINEIVKWINDTH